MEWVSVETEKPKDLTAYGSGTQYLVTVDCCSWDKKKTLVMSWCKETIRGKVVERWKWNDRLVDAHWIVTAWMPFPPPKED